MTRAEQHYEVTDGVTSEFLLRGYFDSPKDAAAAFLAAFGHEFYDTMLVYLSEEGSETYGMVSGALCPMGRRPRLDLDDR